MRAPRRGPATSAPRALARALLRRAGPLGRLLPAFLLPAALSCGPGPCRAQEPSDFAEARERMVREQIAARGVRDPAVLEAMRRVPRHAFVPEPLRERAYDDVPLPIGSGQTISQPYVVAFMTEALRLRPGDRVLEIGTGSGYQAAVLARIVDHVVTIEILPELADGARATLARLGVGSVRVITGDGYRGWPAEAPYDAILVTAAPDHVPEPLVAQLAEGGRLVMPVGDRIQALRRITRTPEGLLDEELLAVRFVPMTGEAQER